MADNLYSPAQLEDLLKNKAIALGTEIMLPVINNVCNESHCIDIEEDGYHYYYKERGIRNDECVTKDADELVFWVFRDITSEMAFQYELEHRIEEQDFRIIAFQKHIELLTKTELRKSFIDNLKLKYNSLLGRQLFYD